MEREKNLEKDPKFERNEDGEKIYALILHNDDVNDFNYVIESLMQVCGHDKVQAEQCAYIVHYGGKCDVKIGSYTQIKSMRNQLSKKGLSVTLNEHICH